MIGKQNSFGTIHILSTPRFNAYQGSKTYNPSYPSGSLSYLNSDKALTTPEHVNTLPSSTTSFGRIKSDKSISYKEFQQNKQNKNFNYPQQMSFKNVNDIESQFKNILSQFQSKRTELDRNIQSPFQVLHDNQSHAGLPSQDSCYVIKQTTDEYNTSTTDDFNNQKIVQEVLPFKLTSDQQQIIDDDDKKIGQNIKIFQKNKNNNFNNTKNEQTNNNNSHYTTFGSTSWVPLKKKYQQNQKKSYSNTQYPFFIIDLKLHEKTQQLVYIPSVPIPQFVSHIIEKHNIDPCHTEYICSLIKDHIDKIN